MLSNKVYLSKIAEEKAGIFDNVIIDAHSLELLKKGGSGQRYAVVGWIDEETKQLHLYFRPSFEEGKADENRSLFAEEDRVESRAGLTGIVHQKVINSVIQQHQKSGDVPPYLLTGKKIGLSFYKRSDSILEKSIHFEFRSVCGESFSKILFLL